MELNNERSSWRKQKNNICVTVQGMLNYKEHIHNTKMKLATELASRNLPTIKSVCAQMERTKQGMYLVAHIPAINASNQETGSYNIICTTGFLPAKVTRCYEWQKRLFEMKFNLHLLLLVPVVCVVSLCLSYVCTVSVFVFVCKCTCVHVYLYIDYTFSFLYKCCILLLLCHTGDVNLYEELAKGSKNSKQSLTFIHSTRPKMFLLVHVYYITNKTFNSPYYKTKLIPVVYEWVFYDE